MVKIGWHIELLDKHGKPTGAVVDVRTLDIVPCSNDDCCFPTQRAAEIYAVENGLKIGVDCIITDHEWDSEEDD